jgi:hypothetical protein
MRDEGSTIVEPRPACRALRTLLFAACQRTLTAVLALVVPLMAAAQPAGSRGDLQTLMGLLAQRKHGHVTYVEAHYLAALDRPLTSTGELVYDAPDHLEKLTLRPKPETLILDHGTMTAHRGRHVYVLSLQDYPQIVPLIDSIRATLAGDLPALERVFTVQLDGSVQKWRLSLSPREASVTKTVKQIRIEGAGTAIQTVEIRQADGDRSLLTVGGEISE